MEVPTRIAIALKGESAAQLAFLVRRQRLFPSGVVRELVAAAYHHVRALEAEEARVAKAATDKIEAERLKTLRRQVAAATLERKAAALDTVAQLKGVEIYGSRFKAFTIDKKSGQRDQIGIYGTAVEAGLAHDGALWERLVENTAMRAPTASDPIPDDFNWPLRDGYMTPNEMDVETCRRAYFQDLLKGNSVVEPGLRKYPPRGFLRPDKDQMLIEFLDKILDSEGVTDQ